jgi:hypothetical protein
MANQCKSCGAPIIWAQVKDSGKAIPLDEKTEMRFILVDTGIVELRHTFQTHFASCPNAKQHRKAE